MPPGRVAFLWSVPLYAEAFVATVLCVESVDWQHGEKRRANIYDQYLWVGAQSRERTGTGTNMAETM